MAPIFFGKVPPNTNALTTAAIVPGTKLLPGEPSVAHVSAHTASWFESDRQAFAHIPEIYASEYYEHNVIVNQGFSGFLTSKDYINVFPTPNLCVTYPNKKGPPESFVERLNTIGFTTMNQNNKVYYMFDKPSLEHLKVIADSKPNGGGWAPTNYANLNSVRQSFVISLILRQAYGVVSNRWQIRKSHGKFGLVKPANAENKMVKGHQIDIGHLCMYEFDPDSMDTNEGDHMHTSFGSTGVPDCQVIPFVRGTIALTPKFNKGGKDLWGQNGFFFPYHRHLARPDIAMIPNLFSKHLMKFLGSTPGQQNKAFTAISAAWGPLCGTTWGHEVAHFARCMEMCIETGSRLCALNIAKHGYTGCVIINTSATIHAYGKVISPSKMDEVQKDIAEHSLKGSALGKILEILKGAGADHTDKHFKHMRELSKVLADVGLTDIQKEEIMGLASNVSFPTERFWPPNIHNIVKAIQLLSSSLPLEQTMPMHFSCIFSSNRLESVWSVFGHLAPTFNLPGGVKHKLASAISPDQGRTRFSIRIVPLLTAVKDLEIIKSTKSVYNFPLPAAIRPGDKGLNVKERDEVWVELRKFAGETEQVVATHPTVSEPDPKDDEVLFGDLF